MTGASEGIAAVASAAGMAISAVKRRHASKLLLSRVKSASLPDVLMQLCCPAHACLLPAVSGGGLVAYKKLVSRRMGAGTLRPYICHKRPPTTEHSSRVSRSWHATSLHGASMLESRMKATLASLACPAG